MTYLAHTHEISKPRHNNLSTKNYIRYWSHISTTTTDEADKKTFASSSREKEKTKTRTTIDSMFLSCHVRFSKGIHTL